MLLNFFLFFRFYSYSNGAPENLEKVEKGSFNPSL
jgi:hypothetical protein